jgi:hypothetical protein
MNTAARECKIPISAALARNSRNGGMQTNSAQKHSPCILNEHKEIACKGHELPYRDVLAVAHDVCRDDFADTEEYRRYRCMTDRRVGPHRIKDLLP